MNSKEFEYIIRNSDGSRGETLEIHYRDGSVVKGFVQRVQFDASSGSYNVNLCKSEVKRGENSNHTVRFDNVIKVVVKPFNKDEMTYE